MVVFAEVKKEEVEKLFKKGFSPEEIKSAYEELRLKKGPVTLIFYTSGKLLLQGRKAEVTEAARLLEKMGLGQRQTGERFRKESGWIIGSDESLKGDTFGGIVVAAVKADENLRRQLVEIGVADSKTLSDTEILILEKKVRQIAPCEVRSLLPDEYNQNREDITFLLNKLHREVGGFLKPGFQIVDKYPGCTVGDAQEEKAESKYVEVAAASVLARAAALHQLDYLSMQAGFTLPKGSTHVQLALLELKQRKLDFRKFTKLDFYNVREFLKENA